MKEKDDTKPLHEEYDPRLESLKYQLDILKDEIGIIERRHTSIDEITQTIKNWAIVIWSGSITVMISNPELKKFIILTAILPASFWIAETFWKQFQRRSGYRWQKISQFLNDERLAISFETKQINDFVIFDPNSKSYRNLPDYKRYISYWRILRWPILSAFYLPLIFISVCLGVYFYFIQP
jgi:hypothetical protein